MIYTRRKQSPMSEQVSVTHICDECARATYDTKHENRNIQTGKPILLICPLVTDRKINIGEKACNKFIPKKQ